MKSLGIILSLILLANVYQNEKVKGPEKTNVLFEMMEVAKENQVNINSWKLYIRKPPTAVHNLSDMGKEIDKIKELEKGFIWTSKENGEEGHYISIGLKQHKSKNITERIIITAFRYGNSYKIYHSHEFEGKNWDQAISHHIDSTYKHVISQNEVYYTVKGNIKEKKRIDIKKQAENILKDFNGEFVEGVIEDHFVSFSAYTSLWDSKLITRDKKYMNLQIGLRNDTDNESVDVTMGTPIITSGY